MQLADTVYRLAGFAGEYRHAETFSLVARSLPSEVHQLVPRNAQLIRISFHIFIEKPLIEIVMAGRHRCMHSVKRGSPNQFHGLSEVQAFGYIVA